MIILLDTEKLIPHGDLKTNVDLDAFAEKFWAVFNDKFYASRQSRAEIFIAALKQVLGQ